MEDMADAFSDRFAGAKGIAEIYHQILFSPETTAATKAKILTKMADYFAATTKQYGDRERIAGMSTEYIEARLRKLLKDNDGVVPIPGVTLHANPSPIPQEEEEQGQGAPQVERLEGEVGEPTPPG